MLSRILDPSTIVRLQSWDASATAPPTLDQVLGTAWPREVGTVASGSADVLCIAPTEWLVIADNPNESELYESLATATRGSSLRATDVSQALTRLKVEDPNIRAFLLQGCSLDLHPDRFQIGQCARTRFAGIPTILCCRDSSKFEAVVAASYREYLLAWITDAIA